MFRAALKDHRIQGLVEQAIESHMGADGDKSAGALSKAIAALLMSASLSFGGAAEDMKPAKMPTGFALLAAEATAATAGEAALMALARGDLSKAIKSNWEIPSVKKYLLEGATDTKTVLDRTVDLLVEGFALPANQKDTQVAMKLFKAKDTRELATKLVYNGMKDDIERLARPELAKTTQAPVTLAQRG